MKEFKSFGPSEINNENKYDEYFEHMKIKKGDDVCFIKECEVGMFYSEKQLEDGKPEVEVITEGEICVVEKDNGEYVDLIFSDDTLGKHVSKLVLKRIK